MNTDRRGFLGALAASLAAVAAEPALRRKDEDVYQNDVLGVRILKPQGWKFINRLEWNLVWADIRYQTDTMSDDELKSLLGQPLVIIARGADHTNVQPNMSLWPDPELEPELPLLDAHQIYPDFCEEYFHDFELLSRPALATLGGVPASRLTFRYTYVSGTERSVRCDVEHFLVLRKQLYVGVNFGRATQGHSAVALQELDSIKRSVVFTS